MRGRTATALAALALVAGVGVTGCGGGDATTTAPTTAAASPSVATGPVLSATAFREKADAACRTLYAKVGALDRPPTSDDGAAKVWYAKAAAVWNDHVQSVQGLAPPADMQAEWAKVFANYVAIAQAAHDNAASANGGKSAIELINSDATQRQVTAGAENADRLRQLGLTGCTGG